MSGVRQRTGTLLAGHALVASFLGATTIRETGLTVWAWTALATLLLGLAVAAILLSPWGLAFAVDAPDLYEAVYDRAADEAEAGTLGWLAAAAFEHHAVRAANARRVTWMSGLSALVAILMVAQTLAWLTGLAVK